MRCGASRIAWEVPCFCLIAAFSSSVYSEKYSSNRLSSDSPVTRTSASRPWLNFKASQGILPIETFVLVTEPLEDRLSDAIKLPYPVSDTRRIENYYRPLPNTRLLWGGGISTKQNPNNLKKKMLADLLSVYPQLKGIKGDMAWSGTMGYGRHRMPQIGRLNKNLWYKKNKHNRML